MIDFGSDLRAQISDGPDLRLCRKSDLSKTAFLRYSELEDGRVSEGTLGTIFFVVFRCERWCLRFLLRPPHLRAQGTKKRPKNASKGVVQEKTSAVLRYLELEDAKVLVKTLGTIFLVVSRLEKWYLKFLLRPRHFRAQGTPFLAKKRPKILAVVKG